MQFWVLPSAGAVGVFLLGLGWILSVLWAGAPGSGWGLLLRDLPWLIPAGLGVYALIVQLFSTWFVVSGIRLVRSRLRDLVEPTRQGWIAAFSGTSLDRLWDRLLDLPARELSARRHDIIIVQGRFIPEDGRAEVARLYQTTLSRTQFFTAFALLLACAGIGWAEGGATAQAAVPVGPLLLAIGALAILAAFGRVLVDASAERLIDTIDNLPVERLDIRLFSRLTELIERATSAPPPPAAIAPAVSLVGPLIDRFSPILDECRGSFLDATARLLANADALHAAAAAISDRAGAAAAAPSDAVRLTEVTAALERLQKIIEELPGKVAASVAPGALQLPAESPARQQFSDELRELLKEFE